MTIQSGMISAMDITGEGNMLVQINTTEIKGLFNKKLVSKDFTVTMTPERFEKELEAVELGRLRKLSKFEPGEHYK